MFLEERAISDRWFSDLYDLTVFHNDTGLAQSFHDMPAHSNTSGTARSILSGHVMRLYVKKGEDTGNTNRYIRGLSS
jgi:hypothetical protein